MKQETGNAPPTVALSIRQPWSWLIAHGYKDVENRTWKTRRRGPVWIHAGKSFDREGWAFVRERFPGIPLPAPAEFARGGIVGAARITDCVSRHLSPWFSGPYGFVLADPEPMPLRPCRGRLGFFQPDFG